MPQDEGVDKPEEDNEETGSDNGDDPPPGEGLSEEVFVVAKILEHMIDMDGVLFFKVRWENYGPADDSWEPADNLASAKERIEAYWVETKASAKKPKTKKTKEKKATPKPSKLASSGSVSRSRGRKSNLKVERKSSPETEPDSEDSAKSGSEDDKYESGKKTKSKPVSKGALKAFDTPKRASRKDKTPPLSTAKKAALANRKTWLDSDSDDSDEEQKKEEKKEETVSRDSVKKEEAPPKSSKKSKRGREESPKNDEPSSKRDKKDEMVRPPTPPKPSRYGQSSSSGTPPPENIEYVEPEEEGQSKIVKMKIKLPVKPSARPCFKSKEKTTSDILYYNRWKKYKPLSEIQELKEIGIMISEKGEWKIFVRDINKTCCILTAEEAFESCGWTLVQYLLARAKFC